MFNINMSKEEAAELFDFISTYLEVVNNTPYVEHLMIQLEDLLDNDEE